MNLVWPPPTAPGTLRPVMKMFSGIVAGFALGFSLVTSLAQDPAPIPTRAQALAALQSVMGPFPSHARGPVPMRIVTESQHDGYVLQDIRYRSEPGDRPGVEVPAYLLIPRPAPVRGARLRAVLALHQTHPAGRKVVAGLGESPDDQYGVELVKRGYVVLAPAYPLLADYSPDVLGLGHASGTMKAIWDNVRGIDLLMGLGFVSTNGVAAIGHSLGGHNGLFTAAFDDRIRVVVTSCGFDSFRDYYDGNPAVWGEERGWCQLRYMPALRAYQGRLDSLPFDFPDVLAAIGPRAVWVNAPKGDSNFRWQSVDRVVDRVRPLWERAGRTDRLEVVHPDHGHRFAPAERQRAYAVIARELD